MSLAQIKPRRSAEGPFPFALVHVAIFFFCLCPGLNRPGSELSFAQIKLRFPARWLFPSALVHAAVLFFFLYPPVCDSLIPPRIIGVRWDDLRSAPHDSMVMTQLYYSRMTLRPAPAAIPSAEKPWNASSPHSKSNSLTPPTHREVIAIPQPIYSGPQEVVSISPNPINSLQTILRPDLVNPPTLKFPQLLKPVVILPSSVPTASDFKPASLVALAISAQPVKNTPVEPPAAKVANPVPLPALEMQRQPLPEIDSEALVRGALAAIVLNAVTVPENAPVTVPQAELSGSFAVRSVRSVHAGAGTSGESTASLDARNAANNVGPRGGEEAVARDSETPIGQGADSPNATGSTFTGNSAATTNLNHLSQLTGSSQVAFSELQSEAAHEAPGITIIGGTSRGGSRVGISGTTTAKYGLTVISSGASGGASRDLGVFERSETVYTVYIPMADVGGGPDLSIQYAILGQMQGGNGLVTPPVAVKKVRAVVSGDLRDVPPTTIFFSAVISERGDLTVKVPLQMDTRARQALDALRHWEFLPAQLNGIAVATKVLVGVGTVLQ